MAATPSATSSLGPPPTTVARRGGGIDTLGRPARRMDGRGGRRSGERVGGLRGGMGRGVGSSADISSHGRERRAREKETRGRDPRSQPRRDESNCWFARHRNPAALGVEGRGTYRSGLGGSHTSRRRAHAAGAHRSQAATRGSKRHCSLSLDALFQLMRGRRR